MQAHSSVQVVARAATPRHEPRFARCGTHFARYHLACMKKSAFAALVKTTSRASTSTSPSAS
ncbi:hypothetical protein ACFPRL_03215 [Pseudoclavibacter helvolus]